MSAKTKIIVLHAKDLILAGLLTAAGLFLILLMILLFLPRKENNAVPTSACYVPGIYKAEVFLGGKAIEVETVLERDRISSIRLVNLDEAITTAYPLLLPTMEHVRDQIYKTQSVQDVTPEPSAKYTSLVLLDAIGNCLEKGRIKED
ncbi:MAG: hypothetical protein IK081_02340 [Lachnospiraceae bacterium]|nr:hypothetical protein [Lachnospiraceae bacterium]